MITDAEVKALIITNKDTTPFIETALLLVSENDAIQALSANRQKTIALYLAAHFVAVSEEYGGIISRTKGDSKEMYQIGKGQGFEITRFGQQAVNLDTSGTLKNLSRQGFNARFTVV